ncbi:MAG: hypothetical protein IH899_02800 [Planctomycetes bacterium]|nr:hypothetical protein [Planctomycetota bacterium]
MTCIESSEPIRLERDQLLQQWLKQVSGSNPGIKRCLTYRVVGWLSIQRVTLDYE